MAQSSTARKKVIIGIHGLANKPEEDLLYEYWRKSVEEGLKKNCNVAQPQFEFTIVYWASLLYRNQQHDDKAYDRPTSRLLANEVGTFYRSPNEISTPEDRYYLVLGVGCNGQEEP